MKSLIIKCGNEEYRDLEIQLKSIQNVFNKRGKRFGRTVKTIENLGSADFEIRQALIYKENYLTMFEEKFQNSPYYEAIVKKLLSYENPLTFRNKILTSCEYGEQLADIDYMYDSVKAELMLKAFAEGLGINTEDIEFLEE